MPSSVISYITYDAPSQILRVRYVSGMIYDYKKVPEEVYLNMKAAFTKGVFLNQHIKNKYEFEKIE